MKCGIVRANRSQKNYIKEGDDKMAGRRLSGDGNIRQKHKNLWEGRIVVGHKNDGTPIFRYVYGNCKQIRFHDLRHTFATRSLENGMDVKTLSSIIGHVSAATTLDIYSHMTDTMQMQAAINIDRKIGGTDAEMPEIETPKQNIKTQPAPDFKPLEQKIRKSGTGCVYQINDTLWEGSYYPRLPGGKRKKFNVYAKTKEECEKLLAEMIKVKKEEIKAEKEKL